MAIQRKGRRPFNYEGREFVWWVDRYWAMHVASADKRFSVSYHFFAEPFMFVAGPEFPGVSPDTPRPLLIVPPEFEQDRCTPALVRELLDWSLDPEHEFASYVGPAADALREMWRDLGDRRAKPVDPERRWLAQGKVIWGAGDRPAALECFGEVLKLDGKFTTYVEIADLLQQHGEGAVDFAARAYGLKPQNAQAAMVYARALRRSADTDGCKRVLNAILARDEFYGPAKRLLEHLSTAAEPWETATVETTMDGRTLQTKSVDGGWIWQWGDWESAPFAFLEYRPWTPQVIGGRLCFSVMENGVWRVVWGDDFGPGFDDAYDIADVDGEPVYVARRDGQSFLVRANRERTMGYDEQLFFRVVDGEIRIGRWLGPVEWLPMNGDGDVMPDEGEE